MRLLLILSLAALAACGPPRVAGVGFGTPGGLETEGAAEPSTQELAEMAQAQAGQ